MSNNPSASTDPVAQAVERLKKDASEGGLVCCYSSDLDLLLADHAAKTEALERIASGGMSMVVGGYRGLCERNRELAVAALATPTTKEK